MNIKQVSKDILSNNIYLSNLYYKTMVFSKARMQKQIEYCQGIDSIADVAALKEFRKQFDKDHPFAPARSQEYSLFRMYGYMNGIFGDIPDNKTIHYPSLEHGLNLQNDIGPETTRMARPSVLTFGAYRKNIIHHYRGWMPVFCIGPYLHYADTYYSEEKLNDLKQKNGKTLLVFPAHSIPGVDVCRNKEKYYGQIRKMASDYDTVLVNVYWWNLNDDIVRQLEAEGYTIVSAGFPYDMNFARRLKTIIRLADLAIGDSIGTHIGFCADENVPFCYLPVDTMNTEIEADMRDQGYLYNIMADITKPFENADTLGDKQKAVLDYYWGLDCIRTSEEIRKIFEINQEITKRGLGTVRGYQRALCYMLEEYMQTDSIKYRLLKDALR